jgi:hypothetical protein
MLEGKEVSNETVLSGLTTELLAKGVEDAASEGVAMLDDTDA